MDKTGEKPFRELSDMGKEVLQLEARSGVPMGSTKSPEAVRELLENQPAETDPDHESVVSERKSHYPKKKKFVRTAEHLAKRVHELVELGFVDPVHVLMEISAGYKMTPTTNPTGQVVLVKSDFEKKPDHKTRALASAELMKYLYPARKAVEMSAGEGQPISFAVLEDTTIIPVMPSDEVIDQMRRDRRQREVDAARTIDAE